MKLVQCLFPKCAKLVVGKLNSRHVENEWYFICGDHLRLVDLVSEEYLETSSRFTRLCADNSEKELLANLVK